MPSKIKGIDLGNHNTKTSSGFIFKATYSEERPSDTFAKFETIEYGNKTYYISEGDFDQNLDKAEKDMIPLFLYALSKKDHYHDVKVVLGLPTTQYNSKKGVMIKKYKGDFNFKLNGRTKSVLVEDVQVFPEGAGAFYVLPADEQKGLVLIVDVGGRTVNICLFENGKLVKIAMYPHGVFDIYLKIYNEINKDGAVAGLDVSYIERNYKNGLTLDGEPVDLSFVEEKISSLVGGIMNTLHDHDFPVRLVDRVRIAGGGADIVEDGLKEKLPNVEVMDNSITANAEGFKVVGDRLWANK